MFLFAGYQKPEKVKEYLYKKTLTSTGIAGPGGPRGPLRPRLPWFPGNPLEP